MNSEKMPKKELIALAVGELVISLAVCAVYLILQRFSYRVPLGALLGSAVVIANFYALSAMTSRILDQFMAERGDGEMSDEQTDELVKTYQNRIQNQMKISYLVRTALMLATLVVAFLVDAFDVIATLVPLLAFRPILTVSEMIKGRLGK